MSMKRAAAFLVPVFLAGPAVAQDHVILSGTVIRLQPTQRAGALAEVQMHNVNANDSHDEIAFDLAIPGLAVAVEFDWEARMDGADAVRVTPPDGVVCLPRDCVLVVPEDATGRLFLFDPQGVGS